MLMLWQRGADRNAWSGCGLGIAREPRLIHGECVAIEQDHSTLDHILELADVAWPVVGLEQRQRRPADPPNALASLRGIPLDQILDEERDVFRPLAERRH